MRQSGESGPSGVRVQSDEIDEVEEVEEVEAVETGTRSTIPLLGRLHTACVHFPIAWVFLLLLVESATLLSRRGELSSVGLPLLALACLSFVPAGVTGFLRASAIGDDPDLRALMLSHRNMNIAAGVACVVALIIRARYREQCRPKAKWLYVALVACAAVLLMLAGHLGGKMVFGPDYLPF